MGRIQENFQVITNQFNKTDIFLWFNLFKNETKPY